MQETFRLMCQAKQQITFKTMFWTFQPKKEQSLTKHLPFITWPVQDMAIERLIDCIRNGGDLLIDKSREMGATWIILGSFLAEWLWMPDSTFLITSRKEEYVWKRGNPDTLYWKLEYMLRHLPLWATPRTDVSERHLLNIENNSVIDGESTNADVGAGGRRQAIMCDEFARVKPSEAQMIQETISDTTPCRIFNSTPVSRGHPFGQLRFSGKIEIVTLPWWEHPWKIKGHYESPNLNQIVIRDIEYYRRKYPSIFDDVQKDVPFFYSDFEKSLLTKRARLEDFYELKFIADGNDPANQTYYSPTGRRSPWYDQQCERRTPRDKAVNIDINYIGAGDVVFNPITLTRMIDKYGSEPCHRGEVIYRVVENIIVNAAWMPNSGRRRLLLWEPLRGSRPDQTHNYIIGCDIAMGSGQSNSVASIFDVNLGKKVGRWLCPFTQPTHFAEQVVALCKWYGGATGLPYLIYENNGPGTIFGRRVLELGYDFVYRDRTEKKVSRKRGDTVGWHSSTDSKLNLMVAYDAAMHATFQEDMESKSFINPDIQSLREAEDYVFYETGSGLGPSGDSDEVGGAKAGHGDMVIADALCQLARYEQPRAQLDQAQFGHTGTILYRRRMAQEQNERQEDLWLIN